MSSDDIFVLHRIIRYISGLAASSFFTEVRVVGAEHVPKSGPMIVYVSRKLAGGRTDVSVVPLLTTI